MGIIEQLEATRAETLRYFDLPEGDLAVASHNRQHLADIERALRPPD